MSLGLSVEVAVTNRTPPIGYGAVGSRIGKIKPLSRAATQASTNGLFYFTDTQATNARRLYRAVKQ